jgi:GTP-binding protein
VPADANDIREEYNILLNELRQYNPELLDKQRVLAISKSDLLDDELKTEIAKDLPDLPFVFISAHNELGLMQLKDMLWLALNPLKP